MLTVPWQLNNLDQFVKIMHIDDGRYLYWPGPLNLCYDLRAYNEFQAAHYNDFRQYQSPNHLYQPTTGGMVNMNAMASSYGDSLPQYQPYYHLNHLNQPENTAGMFNMNFMASLDSDSLQPYRLPRLQAYQSPDHLGYLDQTENTGLMDSMSAMAPYPVDHHRPYQSPYDPVHLDQYNNMGWMDNMNAMASSGGADNFGSVDWAEEWASMDPYHAERLTS